ncbi:MAG: M48 family metalloprotease [Bdellovibrionales bacterium]|nr:M48 family metalloprotease [Bdellovibrionales bacterium]
MSVLAAVRWFFFAFYVAIFFTLPPWLLWERKGLLVGLFLTAVFIYWLRVHATERIQKRLGVQKLTFAEAPHVHSIVGEYCRRLKIKKPQLDLLDSPSLNIAQFGFRQGASHLVLTRGLLDELREPELAAVLARELVLLKEGEVPGQSWLSQFLAVMDWFVGTPVKISSHHVRREYSLKLVSRQVVFYPLSLFPTFLLRSRRDPGRVDILSLKLSRKPEALAEALRFMDAMKDRHPLAVPFNARHLFLLPPTTKDPLARIFFDGEELHPRIGNLEKLRRVLALS